MIFSGDASPLEFDKIRTAIVGTIPEFVDRFKSSIDPAWVAAIGSARRWKELKVRDSLKCFNFQYRPEFDTVDDGNEFKLGDEDKGHPNRKL